MKQAIYGLILYVFLMIPPVVHLSESIMSIHMHMQMPLLGIAGMFMTPFLQKKFPSFFKKWNENGIPGIILFFIVFFYWLLPRAMDETLILTHVEVFKFISWPFLIGVSLRDSWAKLSNAWKNAVYIIVSVAYLGMAWLYIFSPDQLCNNYLIVEQRTLGWGFLLIAFCILLYFVQTLFIDQSQYE
ncbi:hypothetical protein ACFSKI_02295 [Pseudogracilibacillus auburnensis]|uniref:Uncharacterized protein n=1 Tax=Pseudogracilibacillus auburnensis TaxID=1494959 RepID=A0A2V3WE13_9BACI|nr:hypothetical protein [Pseudogracilibacillus auburnensis]MBO1002964.1 hypothetical protein [Pseudogracilibacillus auburnensis]PXW87059.1 hypothetical protein DFR56_106128 [Pseudogracilibacillus auburnensis]